jgi:hypothetical protein
MTGVTMVESTERALSEGTHVEVRNRFDSQWTRGFVVAEVLPDGYRIRRSADAQALPTTFTADEVRREHRRGQWWY